VRVGETEIEEVEHRFMTRGIVPSERSRPGNLSLRPLDDLDQHLLAFFDAEMAEVPIELVASGVEITDRSCPLEVDLDTLAHFLEGDGDVVDLLARRVVDRRNFFGVDERVRALAFSMASASVQI
jgi:hypothetical protein